MAVFAGVITIIMNSYVSFVKDLVTKYTNNVACSNIDIILMIIIYGWMAEIGGSLGGIRLNNAVLVLRE